MSVNQEAVDPSLVVSSPVVQGETTPSINPHINSVDAFLESSYTSPFCTSVPLELHIDEDGCSAPTTSAGTTFIAASSKYSQIQQKEHDGRVTSEISHVEHFTTSCTQEPSCPSEVNSSMQMSVIKVSSSTASDLVTIDRGSSSAPPAQSSSPVVVSKSPCPVTVSKSLYFRTKSPCPPDPKCSSHSPEPISHSSEATHRNKSPVTVHKTVNPVIVPRLSSPVPKITSSIIVPNISSSVTIPKSPSPETIPKSASSVSVPRLSSPVPKILSPVTIPSISSLPVVPKSCSPETVPKSPFAVIPQRLSSPVTVPKSETALSKSPAPVIRKTYMVPDNSSPRAPPVTSATAPSKCLSPPPTEKGDVLDLTWPCREPLLDDALGKLLTTDFTQPNDNQPLTTSGDEDRFWEEEDGIYPDISREGTLTPMTESSWMDECFTPSSCPGTPDATLDLPIQQPTAVERLSASGQVGCSTQFKSPKISCWHKARGALGPHFVLCYLIYTVSDNNGSVALLEDCSSRVYH